MSVNVESWQIVVTLLTTLGIPTLLVKWQSNRDKRKQIEEQDEKEEAAAKSIELNDIRVLLKSQNQELKEQIQKLTLDWRERLAQYEELVSQLRQEIDGLKEIKNELLLKVANLTQALQIALKIIEELDPEHREFITGLLDDEDESN